MRVRAGWLTVVLGVVVLAFLALGVAQVIGGDAPDAAEDATDGAVPPPGGRRSRPRGESGHAEGTDAAGATGGRASRSVRARAAAPGDAAGDVEAARVRAADGGAAPATESTGAVAAVVADPSHDDRVGAKSASGGRLPGAGAARGRAASSSRVETGRRRPGTLTIIVRAAETGAPLRDVDVTILVDDAKPEVVRADAGGRVVWPLDPQSTAEVRVKVPGRVVERRTGLTVAPEKDTPVTFDLARGVLVTGAVTRGQGVPVVGARVRAWTLTDWRSVMPLEDERLPLADVLTDRAGRYLVDVVPRGVQAIVVVEAAGLATGGGIVAPEPDPDSTVRVDVALVPGAAFSGTVVDGSSGAPGAPVAGARVLAFRPVDVAEVRKHRYFLLTDLSDARIVEHAVLDDIDDFARAWGSGRFIRHCRAVSDEKGGFTISGCPADTKLRLVAFAPGLGRSAPSAEVGPKDRPTLSLRGRFPVQIEVRTPRGEPAEDARVERFWSWETWTAAALGRGLAGTPVLDVGVHRVPVVAKGLASNHYALLVDRPEHGPALSAVRLREGYAVSGVTVDDLGAPVATAKVGRALRFVESAANGTFTFDGLDPRWDYGIGARAPSHLDAWHKLTGRSESGVKLQLNRESVVVARLRLPDGAAEPAWRRIAVSDGRGFGPSGDARPDELVWDGGVVQVGGLSAGGREVAFIVPRMKVAIREAKTAIGATTDLGDIQLVPARRVDGIVQDESGAACAGAEVVLKPRFRRDTPAARTAWFVREHVPQRVTVTGEDGKFALDVVLDDVQFTAEARLPDGSEGSAPVPDATDPVEPAKPLVVVAARTVARTGRIAGTGPWTSLRVLWSDGRRTLEDVGVEADGTFGARVPGTPTEVLVYGGGRTARAAIDPSADPAVPVVVAWR